MKKIALFLCFLLSFGIVSPIASFAEEAVLISAPAFSDTIPLPNPGFEKEGGWEMVDGAYITDEYAHSGQYSLALPTVEGGSDPEGIATVSGFVKGATYEISGWILNPSSTTYDIGFWLYYSSKDFYDWNDTASQLGIEKGTTRWQLGYNGHFQRFTGQFTPPENTESVMISLRHRLTPGIVYVDDMEIKMVKAPSVIDAKTDEVFYYSEWKTGTLSGVPMFLSDAVASKAEVSFVTPSGSEQNKEIFSDLSNGFTYTFRTDWMEEKGKRYHIRMHVYGPDGSLLQSEDFPVFRFDRPTYLGADGVFRKNGKEYNYASGAGVTREWLDAYNPEEGVTIIQLIANASIEEMLNNMDAAYEKGLLCMINLYSGSSCAGSENMIGRTIEVVTAIKDHPALFAYKAQDEAYQKGNTDEEMIRAYETIRNIDPHHPVYHCDSVTGGLSWLFRYCDILDTAYFHGGNEDAGRKTSEAMDIAMEASKGRKPFSVCMQAFPMSGYLPSLDELRHMIYQGFFSGGCGVEFHSLGIDATDGNNTVYMTRPEWNDLVTKWANWERDFMFDCFVNGKYKFVNYEKTNDVMWATFTDGKDIYAICLNRNKSTETVASIPLTDGTGTLQIGAFTANRMVGENETITGNGALSLNLKPWEAAVWEITPDEGMDTSFLKASAFNDVMYTPWAYNAIATLEEKNIVNGVSDTWFGPSENITRGDYAMFLVRALGLTEGAGENFVDVAPDAEYAKELAIGKAHGIINGVGENKFTPEAEITRQDMMTMTARALKLAGAADLGSFSDSGMIADYAASHVCAMVAEGLIKGNADGTINPLGNTTRAEAAVIMNRIISK